MMSDDELKAIVERELNMYDARWYHLCDEDNGIALDKAWLARGVIWEVARRVAEAERERAAKVAEDEAESAIELQRMGMPPASANTYIGWMEDIAAKRRMLK